MPNSPVSQHQKPLRTAQRNSGRDTDYVARSYGGGSVAANVAIRLYLLRLPNPAQPTPDSLQNMPLDSFQADCVKYMDTEKQGRKGIPQMNRFKDDNRESI